MKDKLLYKLLRPFLVIYMRIFYKPEIIGLENIPKEGRCILVANHSSNLDFISMGITTKRCVHFLAKEELFVGILSPIMNGVGAIPVNRKIKDKTPIIRGRKVLDNNLVLGIFPEGTFNKTDDVIAPFKIGAVKLAKESNSVIIPIMIVGEYKFKKLKIIVDKPFWVETSDLDYENDKLMCRFKNRMKIYKGGK